MKTSVSKSKKSAVQPSKTTLTPVNQQGCKTSCPKQVVPIALSHEAIAKRAYEIYVRNGYTQGQCEQNWIQAEQELKSQN